MSVINDEAFPFDSFSPVLRFQLAELPVVLKIKKIKSKLGSSSSDFGDSM